MRKLRYPFSKNEEVVLKTKTIENESIENKLDQGEEVKNFDAEFSRYLIIGLLVVLGFVSGILNKPNCMRDKDEIKIIKPITPSVIEQEDPSDKEINESSISKSDYFKNQDKAYQLARQKALNSHADMPELNDAKNLRKAIELGEKFYVDAYREAYKPYEKDLVRELDEDKYDAEKHRKMLREAARRSVWE